MKKLSKFLGAGLLASVTCGYLAAPAHAVPKLQIYIEGAAYSTTDDTWYFSGGPNFRLWVIGDLNDAGGQYPITDIKLVASYDQAMSIPPFPIIQLTPTSIGGTGSYNGFTDTGAPPPAPVWLGETTDGSVPLTNSGGQLDNLPPHGIFGAGTNWQEFALGDMTTEEDPAGDFQIAFPNPSASQQVQIWAYDVAVLSVVPGVGGIHFDAFGTQNGSDVFAPFSHDASWTDQPPGDIPEPASLVVLGLGLAGFGWMRRRTRVAA